MLAPPKWNRFSANIEFFFKTRHYRYPDKAVTKGAEAQVVKFENWGVADDHLDHGAAPRKPFRLI
jgi:hypothetical protein